MFVYVCVALSEEFEEEKLVKIEALQKMKEESNERIMRTERLINASIVSTLFFSQTSAPTISTTILKVLTPAIVAPTFYDAEPSYVKEFEPSIKTRAYSPPKANGKNKLQLDLPFPKNDEEKLMGKQIKEFKEFSIKFAQEIEDPIQWTENSHSTLLDDGIQGWRWIQEILQVGGPTI